MVDYLYLAIADVLKHPRLGLVSHQPDIHEQISNIISVRDMNFILHHGILASDCEDVTREEVDLYWSEVNKIIEKKNNNTYKIV